MPNLYGLINNLPLITPLVGLFREIVHSFLKTLIRADEADVHCKTVWDMLAAIRGWQFVGKRYWWKSVGLV